MKIYQRGHKRFGVVFFTILFILASFYLHKAYAGKPTVSLNSPVSFPVDI